MSNPIPPEDILLAQLFVSYAESKEMVSYFSVAVHRQTTEKLKVGMASIMHYLELVRDIDYSPLPGAQILPSKSELSALAEYYKTKGINIQ